MIYFLSDAHLGSRVIADREGHVARLCRLLRQMGEDASHIFLLGDIFDFWYEYLFEPHRWLHADGSWHMPRSKRLYLPLMQTLRALTDKGIEVHFFIGNHDIWTFGDLARNTGIRVHRQPEAFTLDGKRIFMAHGDGIVPSDFMQRLPQQLQTKIRRFMRLRAFFHHPVPQFLFRLLPPSLGDAFGYEWARHSRLKELRHPCPYKGEQNEELVQWAKEHPEYDYCVFGHRHIRLDLDPGNSRRVLILGDFFQQFTYAVLHNGQLQICQYTL